MDREVKSLKRSRMPFVKVRWNSKRGPELVKSRDEIPIRRGYCDNRGLSGIWNCLSIQSDAWTVCGYYMLCATCSGYGTLQGFVIKWSGFCGTLQGFVIKWSGFCGTLQGFVIKWSGLCERDVS
ncbi:hypothetical protein Tco_1297172 [Tanacetum coccineum]